ncbi:transmembrane protein [Tieghemostelium lacteum]|uniref:Transmembrane protein n=1 Tax=Tieghemostelium lacteum TaxID=361077 RepID=A0A151ZBL4_TIELA|nr:transmembrane protein [Tieghemostelium lacteum]|eukprot:KYQ91329.1 transmembrane protein [Tieghemostelium lacteum]
MNINNKDEDFENQDLSPNPLLRSIRKLSDPTVFIDYINNNSSNNDNTNNLDQNPDQFNLHHSNDHQHFHHHSAQLDSNNSSNNNNSNSPEQQTVLKSSSFTNISLNTSSDNMMMRKSTSGISTSGATSPNLITSSSGGGSMKKSRDSTRTVMCLVSLVLVSTQLLGIFLFAQGFFPRKASLEGYNTFQNYQASCTENDVQVDPQYGKLVFMLVDAFRSNFLFSEDAKEHMKFTRSLIDTGKAYSYIARANAPTVTLPRVKALLSGGIPSFVDFVNNFNSKDLKDDNILYQLKHSANKSMVFYGDDTWLKLFPEYFKRHDGTTSFYVADTVEVDNNVTRHLDEEFQNYQDWDAMFLHYLGLDHIGHLEGPYSHLMHPKQREIDDIIKRIHQEVLRIDEEQLEQWNSTGDKPKPLPTLFVFCSDHGMNEIGNHGGSTDSETSAVLVMMSSVYYHQSDPKPSHAQEDSSHANEDSLESHNFGRIQETHESDILPTTPQQSIGREVDQVDLVPSLSFLFNLPIPKNSLGKVIPELFENFLPTEQYLRVLEINCQQQLDLLKNNALFWNLKENKAQSQNVQNLVNLFVDAQQYHSSWSLTPSHSHFHENAANLYKEFLENIHEEFSRLLTSFDENLLIIGLLSIGSSALVTLLISTATISMSGHQSNFEIKGVSFAITFIGIVATVIGIHFGFICSNDLNQDKYYCTKDFRYVLLSFICTTLSLLIGFNAIISRNNLKLWTNQGIAQLRKEKYIIVVGTILHLISLFGSSLVEEEHQTWYYLTTSVILLQITPHSISILTYFNNTLNKQSSSSNNNLSMSKNVGLQQHQTKISYKQMFILLSILFTLRIMRVWNQTGIKWLDDPQLLDGKTFIDFGRYLNSNQFTSNVLLWTLSLISIIVPCIYVFKLLEELKNQKGGILSKLSFLYKIIIIIQSIALFCYKWEYIPVELLENVFVARIVYLCFILLMTITFLFPFFSKKDRIIMNTITPPSWFIATLKYVPTLIVVNLTMLFLLIHRTHNMILLTMMGGIGHFYLKYLLEDTGRRAKSGMVGVSVGLICINWLGQFGYFSFGNSNSLSTIDISGSYTGVIDYNQYVVGALTFLIGYTSQIFFFFVGLAYSTNLAIKSVSSGHHEPSLMLPTPPGTSQDIIDELQWYSLVGTLLDCGLKWTNVFVFSLCVIVQRFHLFIWTVFSPKYIYEVMDVSLVLVKALLLALFIIYLRILTSIREKPIYENILNQSSSNLNKEE